MAIRSPTRRLNKVLFPTLGLPTSATIGFIRLSIYEFSIMVPMMELVCLAQRSPLPPFQARLILPVHCPPLLLLPESIDRSRAPSPRHLQIPKYLLRSKHPTRAEV